MDGSGHTFSEQRINLNEDKALFPDVIREIAIRTSQDMGLLFRGNSKGKWWCSFRLWSTLYTKNAEHVDISAVPLNTTQSCTIIFGGFQIKVSKYSDGDVSLSAESIPSILK